MFISYQQILCHRNSIRWIICFFYLIAMDASGDSVGMTLEEYALKPFGNVIFLRHAFAPGMDAKGQPAKFKIDDCSTQRNLDSRGVAQATAIGKKFIANGIEFENIFSSQWCRCLETAQLLGVGEVTRKAALNSGFRGLFKLEESLANLRKYLESLMDKEKPILMVTHRGVILAITGISVKSGGAVAYDTNAKTSIIISID